MRTQYIGHPLRFIKVLHNRGNETEKSMPAELRVEESEEYPGMYEVIAFRYDTDDVHARVILSLNDAKELRDAMNVVLGEAAG